MSQQATEAHSENHEGPIKTPKQLIWAVSLSFVVPVILIIMLANYVASDKKTNAGTDSMSDQAVAARIQAIGSIELKAASGDGAARGGEEVYKGQCAACHATGLMNSPKFQDAAAWGSRLSAGFDALLNSALKGKGSMAPQGGGEFSDYEISRAVVYMANQAGGKLAEPKAPAGAASGAAPAASK